MALPVLITQKIADLERLHTKKGIPVHSDTPNPLAELVKDPKEKPIFEVGQTVRVVSHIDVNFPENCYFWLDTKCEVLAVVPRGFFGREWCYRLKHPNGSVDEFKAEELDKRYRKR